MGLDTKTYWLTDRQSQCDFDFDVAVYGTVVEYRVKSRVSGRLPAEIWA
jgi:hypothetical protein